MTSLVLAAEDVAFDRMDDVIVVGTGGAGLCAALEAAVSGARVLVLERASGAGGSTGLAGGYIYLGGGTEIQHANGFDDTVEAMYDYLLASTPIPDAAKIRAYCEGSVSHFEWLRAMGVPFNVGFYAEKHFEHPTPDSLAWTGNEKVWPFAKIATAQPRGHRAAATPGTGGAALVAALTAQAEAAQTIAMNYDERVTALIADAQGRICGVQSRSFGEVRHYGARGGVVLATGGFGMNDALVARHCPSLGRAGIEIIGTPNSDGSGLELALAAGAEIQFPGAIFVTSPVYPPGALLEGILVNREGRRFVAEDSYHGRTTAAMLRQPGEKVWLICDVESFDRPVMGQDLVDAWDDLAEMEKDLRIPAGSLVETIGRYNADAASGEDSDFHKSPDYLRAIDKAPFAAIDCSLGAAPYLGFTLGGLRTDVDGRVLGAHEMPVPGLYAAGAVAANIAAAQGLENYASGTCIGESTFFGRRCGREAATAAKYRNMTSGEL